MKMTKCLVAAIATVGIAVPAYAGPGGATGAMTDGTIADVAEKVVSSVVNVSSKQVVESGPAMFDPFFTDPSSPFFGLEPEKREATSMGSGVIVTSKGRVLTNAHVIDGAKAVLVTTSDGTELEAKVVGIDKRSDVAVLQLQGDLPKLTPLAFGDASKLRLGEVVLAVGNPFGVGQSVTMGIVSAKGRATGSSDYQDFIQTDAAINPGNSGGALVNLKGELVGINTAILSRNGGYQGVGFAIPSDMAKPIMDMLVRDGKVTRGYLGVGIATVNKELAKQQKLPVVHGVLITGVEPKSPAAKAGLREGDVVVAIDGAEIRDSNKLRNTIAMRGAGKGAELTVLRGNDRKNLKITLAELPDPSAVKKSAPAPKRPAARPLVPDFEDDE